jgi:hypothetical protein
MSITSTLVIQSHRSPLPFSWLKDCLESVQQWAALNDYDYVFLGDELFDLVPDDLIYKTRHQKVIATDLARLFHLQTNLKNGYSTVIWCDADFLIFNPGQFTIPDETYALGREVWIQQDKHQQLKCHRKVHNAFLMFRQGNVFLDFYTDSAQRLLSINEGSIPPQFIGPKLLSALHNIVQCPVLESAGMLSPLVLQDIARGGGDALQLMLNNSTSPVMAANICASLANQQDLNEELIITVIHKMIHTKNL